MKLLTMSIHIVDWAILSAPFKTHLLLMLWNIFSLFNISVNKSCILYEYFSIFSRIYLCTRENKADAAHERRQIYINLVSVSSIIQYFYYTGQNRHRRIKYGSHSSWFFNQYNYKDRTNANILLKKVYTIMNITWLISFIRNLLNIWRFKIIQYH